MSNALKEYQAQGLAPVDSVSSAMISGNTQIWVIRTIKNLLSIFSEYHVL